MLRTSKSPLALREGCILDAFRVPPFAVSWNRKRTLFVRLGQVRRVFFCVSSDTLERRKQCANKPDAQFLSLFAANGIFGTFGSARQTLATSSKRILRFCLFVRSRDLCCLDNGRHCAASLLKQSFTLSLSKNAVQLFVGCSALKPKLRTMPCGGKTLRHCPRDSFGYSFSDKVPKWAERRDTLPYGGGYPCLKFHINEHTGEIRKTPGKPCRCCFAREGRCWMLLGSGKKSIGKNKGMRRLHRRLFEEDALFARGRPGEFEQSN